MDVFKLFGEQDWDGENDRPGYRHRATAIGERLGATLLGGGLSSCRRARRPGPITTRSAARSG